MQSDIFLKTPYPTTSCSDACGNCLSSTNVSLR